MTAAVKQFGNGLKLGKLPARENAVQLKFSSYLDLATLPTPPADFGHENLVPDFPMFMNDQLGDCVIAGSLHQIQLYNREAGKTVTPVDHDALKNYEVVGGYDPQDPSTDGGCDMEAAASYWRKTGMLAAGKHHKIAAYVDLQPGNLNQVRTACYLFGAVGLGIEFPAFAMDQFDAGKPWDVQKTNAKVEGGHYIPMIADRGGNLYVVTWGRVTQMTPAFFKKYADQVVLHFSSEMLLQGKSLEGFNTEALTADLQAVTKQH